MKVTIFSASSKAFLSTTGFLSFLARGFVVVRNRVAFRCGVVPLCLNVYWGAGSLTQNYFCTISVKCAHSEKGKSFLTLFWKLFWSHGSSALCRSCFEEGKSRGNERIHGKRGPLLSEGLCCCRGLSVWVPWPVVASAGCPLSATALSGGLRQCLWLLHALCLSTCSPGASVAVPGRVVA